MGKKKTPKDIFETQCWLNKVISDPYQVLANVFFSSGVQHLRSFVKEIMESAIDKNIYKTKSPADALLYKRYIASLIKVANILKEKKSSEIKINNGDLLDNRYFACGRLLTDDWSDFPRFLSKKEFCNPYIVFRKFFKSYALNSWLTALTDIIDGALCPEESHLFLNEITIYTKLVKLIEAAHLIDVREVVHVDGLLKGRSNDINY